MDYGIRGKIALVTGANHGIGAAIAKMLAQAGTEVFITYYRLPAESDADAYGRNRAQDADAVIAECRAAGVRAHSAEIDLSDSASIPALLDRVEAVLGSVDILVNNAAAWQADTFVPPSIREAQVWPPPELMGAITPRSIDLHFAVNARAPALLMAEYAARHIRGGKTWGRIVNITTDGASNFPGEVSYGASKYALESYTHSAASELGAFGITINLVSPGPTQTGWITEENARDLAARTPLRRVGLPDDIAQAVLLFASEQGSWLTGQMLRAGGGWSLGS
jgi:3-oxoacyl-[acyl-carrier protein] reductase